jgi:hypothetical protein
MEAQSEGEDSQLPRWSQDSSQSSASSATTTIPSTPSAPPVTTGSQQTHLKDEFEELAAFLADEKAPKKVRSAFRRIYDAFQERVEKQATTDAIHTLQEAVRKLAAKIVEKLVGTNETGLLGSSYAAAVQRGAAVAAQSCMQGYTEPVKPVPAQHKRGIIVSRA